MEKKRRSPQPERERDERRVNSRTLLGGGSSLLIEHEGAVYRLRVTRQGKLILTK